MNFDLIEEIKKTLLTMGVRQTYVNYFLNHNEVQKAVGLPDIQQKVHLSLFFGKEIFNREMDPPMSLRLALSCNGDSLEWLDVYKLVVIPYMIKRDFIEVTYDKSQSS